MFQNDTSRSSKIMALQGKSDPNTVKSSTRARQMEIGLKDMDFASVELKQNILDQQQPVGR